MPGNPEDWYEKYAFVHDGDWPRERMRMVHPRMQPIPVELQPWQKEVLDRLFEASRTEYPSLLIDYSILEERMMGLYAGHKPTVVIFDDIPPLVSEEIIDLVLKDKVYDLPDPVERFVEKPSHRADPKRPAWAERNQPSFSAKKSRRHRNGRR